MNNYDSNLSLKERHQRNWNIWIGIIVLAILGIGIFCYFQFFQSPSDNKADDGKQNINSDTPTVNPDTNLTYDETGAFLMAIEEVFVISDKGTVVTGKIEHGTIKVGDQVQILGLDEEVITTTVERIEQFSKETDIAKVGDSVGLRLKEVSREQLKRGQVVAQPNSIVAATKFEADLYVLSKEEGGRHTPFFNLYRPQFSFWTANITGVITLEDGVEMVNPGENVKVTVELISSIAMKKGTTFTIREGGRTVGRGTITKVY